MERDPVEIPFPGNFLGIANRPIDLLTDQECLDMASWYYDRYTWVTDDIEDLHLAALYKHLAESRSTYVVPIKLKPVRDLLYYFYRREPKRPDFLSRHYFPKRF